MAERYLLGPTICSENVKCDIVDLEDVVYENLSFKNVYLNNALRFIFS